MSEFNPRTDGLANAHRVASWLIKLSATLHPVGYPDFGYVATDLIVPDYDQNGAWIVPLIGCIDLVDENDARFASKDPVMVRVTGMTDDQPARVEVSYYATDDEIRTAEVDSERPAIFKPYN